MPETIEIQLKKGVLGLCVLALLARADSYAYEIASRLSDAIDMGEGTIYPLMRRMQSDGLVETYLVEVLFRPVAQILSAQPRRSRCAGRPDLPNGPISPAPWMRSSPTIQPPSPPPERPA